MLIVKKRLRTAPCYAGRRRIKRKKKRSSLLKKLLSFRSRVLRYSRLINRRIESLVNTVNLLAAQVNTITAPTQGARALLQGRMGSVVSIETNAGSISGTIVEVGVDYVQILEPTGDIVLIPLRSITTVE